MVSQDNANRASAQALTVLLIIFAMISAVSCVKGSPEGQAQTAGQGMFGFINKDGEMVIQPKYQNAGSFSEGLAAVKIDNKWGFINNSGDLVIEPAFYWGLDDGSNTPEGPSFNEGLAAITFENGKEGYIDKTGRTIIEPQYDIAENFHEGLAVVYVDGKWGFIDKTGAIVISPTYSMAWSFTEGLASVAIGEMPSGGISVSGCIDKAGNMVIEPQFANEHGAWFSEGLAAVSWSRESSFGYVDRSGSKVIDDMFWRADDFSEGLAFAISSGKTGFINKTGAFEFLVDCYEADGFNEGYSRIRIWDGRINSYGFVDRYGVVAVKPVYPSAGSFSGGLAYVCTEESELYGFIDSSGAIVIPQQFEIARSFSDGLAAVKVH